MARLLDPLIKSGDVGTGTVFTADFAKKYGGDNDKILMMPGPTWYAQARVLASLKDPGRRDHGRACRCAGTRIRSRPVRSVAARGSSPSTREHGRGGRLRAVGHDDERGTAERRPNYPAYKPAAERLALQDGSRPVVRRSSDAGAEGGRGPDLAGWNMVTYPDQPVVGDHGRRRPGRRASR